VIAVIGIDPGDTAGFLLAGWEREVKKAVFARAFQCDGDSAVATLKMILYLTRLEGFTVTAAQVEAFDDRPGRRGLRGTSRSRIQGQVDALAVILGEHGIPVYARQVSDVKSWATDERLKGAGIWDVVSPAAMVHARDAAKHALFCAVHDCGVIDPLSRQMRKQEA
jgi:hypothetical protein